HEKMRAENAKRVAAWNASNHRLLAGWRSRTGKQIDKAGRATEESKRWDLPGTLVRAGTDLRGISPGASRQNCLVLLGGLAVQRPPTNADLSSLEGANIIVTGWRSTEQVQTLWKERASDVGASIEFLPADVTDFMLEDAVARCTAPTT